VSQRVRNFLTIDVEEWFHICGVDGPLAADRWLALPSRVEFTTDLVLDLLARHRIRATFFVLGWIAGRHPDLVARILDAGTDRRTVLPRGKLDEASLERARSDRRPWNRPR
jgi:hypothetical protein